MQQYYIRMINGGKNVTINTLQINDLTIEYFRFGDPAGKPFVIIPGVAVRSVMESADFINVQYRALAEEYDIYVIDRRKDMPAGYSVYDMADDTVRAMDMLYLKNAVVYGVSQGGMIGQTIAVKRPDLVQKLILCSTSSHIPQDAVKIINKWIEFAENKNLRALMLSFAENIYTKAYCEKYRDAFIMFERLITDEDLQRFLIMVKGCDGFDVRDSLESIDAPVLVLGGRDDKIFPPENAEEIAELTKGELYIYENAAHGVYDENADVIARIKEFAERT